MRNVEVVVQLDADFAGRLRRGVASGPEALQLQGLLTAAGATLRPQHPETADRELARWFVAQTSDRGEGSRLAAALNALPCVNAAYAKPAAELPQ